MEKLLALERQRNLLVESVLKKIYSSCYSYDQGKCQETQKRISVLERDVNTLKTLNQWAYESAMIPSKTITVATQTMVQPKPQPRPQSQPKPKVKTKYYYTPNISTSKKSSFFAGNRMKTLLYESPPEKLRNSEVLTQTPVPYKTIYDKMQKKIQKTTTRTPSAYSKIADLVKKDREGWKKQQIL